MKAWSEGEIRGAFVNLSKGATARVNLPADLAETDWASVDFLGWIDPKAPERAYIAAEREGGLCAVAFRSGASALPRGRKTMCDLCLSVGSVTLMAAPRRGKAGQRGDTVGSYLCADLACSQRARGGRSNGTIVMEETLTVEQKVDRLMANLATVVNRVMADS